MARADEFGVEWSASLVFLAHNVAAFPLLMAADHLRAWAHLTHTCAHQYADVAAFRSVLEACARSTWICDPQLSGEQRIGRALVDLTHDADKLGDLHGRSWAKTIERQHQDAAIRLGITLEDRPGTRRLLKGLLGTDGQRAWALGSAYTHGGFWTGFGQSNETVINPTTGIKRLIPRQRAHEESALMLHYMLVVFRLAHSQRMKWHGIDDSAWTNSLETVSQHFEHLLPQ